MKVTVIELKDYPWNSDTRGEMCMRLATRVFSGYQAPRHLLAMRECSQEEIAVIIPPEIKFESRVTDLETDGMAKGLYDGFYGHGSVDEMLHRQQKTA